MGRLFVLAFWGFLGSVLAVVGGFLAHRVASSLTRGQANGPLRSAREDVLRSASLFPLACLLWAVAIFVFQGVVNTAFLHRDPGLGDSSYCPLPNGDTLLMIDVSDQGTVYRSTAQPRESVGDHDDAISGVREMQIAGPYIFGGFDSDYSRHFGEGSSGVNRYFVIDTRAGERLNFDTEVQLINHASSLGTQLDLEPVFDVSTGLVPGSHASRRNTLTRCCGSSDAFKRW
jgi:hypothetical protein